MKTYKWAELFRHHPIFSELKDKEVRLLLDDEASEEHNYAQGAAVFHAGEVGDSVYLIGSGLLDAAIPLEGGNQVKLSMMRKGETFGEMALLESRPRSASVIAREASTVLEIGGREFRKMLEKHPGMEVKLLLTVSERLRNAGEELMKLHLHGIDDKLQFFNAKLDVEHRIVDTSLKAAQTVFDQTRQRAEEVINSVERMQSNIGTTFKVIATVATVLVATFGGLGAWGLNWIKNEVNSVKKEVKSVEDIKDKLGTAVTQAEKAVEDVNNLTRESQKDLASIKSAVEEAKTAISGGFEIEIPQQVKAKDWAVVLTYKKARKIDANTEEIFPELARQFMETFRTKKVTEKVKDEDIQYWTHISSNIKDYKPEEWYPTTKNERWGYYLLIATYALTKTALDFDVKLKEFTDFIEDQQKRGLEITKVDETMFTTLESAFEKKPEEQAVLFDKAIKAAKKLPKS